MPKNVSTTLLTVLITTTELPVTPLPTILPISMSIFMLIGYILLFFLRAISFITTCAVVYSIIRRNDFLNPIIRTCMCVMYCGSFLSDIGYSLVLVAKIQNESTSIFISGADLSPLIVRLIFFHELGFATFGIGIFVTATERLINSRTDFYLQHKRFSYLIALLLIPVIVGISSVWANGLTDMRYNVAAAIVGGVFFIIASVMLFLAVTFSIRSYKKGLGQSLDKRFKSASTYYFNRHLFISLVGEICMRIFAYSFIFSVATGITMAFEECAFVYHNLLAVSNVIFPWIIILRSGKSTVIGSRSGVTDLTGNQLRLRASGQEYHNFLAKIWQ